MLKGFQGCLPVLGVERGWNSVLLWLWGCFLSFSFFKIISGALLSEVSTWRFVSQMLCHEWSHGAPSLAQLLCPAFSVTVNAGNCKCWDFRCSYQCCVLCCRKRPFAVNWVIIIFSCDKNWCLTLKVFKLHVWPHLEINSSCICVHAQMCMGASQAGAHMEVCKAAGHLAL